MPGIEPDGHQFPIDKITPATIGGAWMNRRAFQFDLNAQIMIASRLDMNRCPEKQGPHPTQRCILDIHHSGRCLIMGLPENLPVPESGKEK